MKGRSRTRVWSAVAAVALLAALSTIGPAQAQTHSAIRAFSSEYVAPGGTLEVTLTASGYGAFGELVEALPAGFTYQSGSLSGAAVNVDGQTVRFLLFGTERVTYTVSAPQAEGSHSFSGIIRDFQRVEQRVGGASAVTVGSPPPRPQQPTPTPTPEPTPTPTPEPTPTPTPEPTPTPTPTPEPTPTPTPEPMATPTPEPTPTHTPGPSPTPTPGVTPTLEPAPTPMPAQGTPTPTPTPTPEPTATPTPEPTATPVRAPTATPAPAPGPALTPTFLRTLLAAIIVVAVAIGGAALWAQRRR